MTKGRFFIGLLLAGIFFYLFLRNIDLHQLWQFMKKGNVYWMVFGGVVTFLNYVMRSVRWRYFLLPIKQTKFRNLFTTTVIGFSASTIFPARIGEVVRPYLLGSKENISKSSALATVVVERLFDSLTILFMLVVYLLLLIKPEQLSAEARASLGELKQAGLAVFAVVLAIGLFLYYLKTRPTLVQKIVRKIDRFLPKKIAHSLEDILDSFIQGLSILHDPKLLLTIGGWSIAFWLVISLGFWGVVRAYITDFAFTNTFLIMILLAIGVAVPTPGGVGSYHLACKIGLSRFFGVPDAQAGAIALVSHFIAFVPVTLLGLLFLWHEGLSAAKLKKMAEKEPASE
jgi:uncharacterized protein (TIRG00374 family)